jgi:hypothetical protein
VAQRRALQQPGTGEHREAIVTLKRNFAADEYSIPFTVTADADGRLRAERLLDLLLDGFTAPPCQDLIAPESVFLSASCAYRSRQVDNAITRHQ